MLTRVVKIGGAQLTDGPWLQTFAEAMAGYGPALIVHGGGTAISHRQKELAIPLVKRDGVRHTSPALATVVRDVLCGEVRRGIVSALRAAGVDPLGVAGLDGFLGVDLIDADRMGRVGRVVDVNTEEIRRLIAAGRTPVLAPISVGSDGGLVNVNADTAAAAAARALGAEELVLVSDVEGVTRRGSVLPTLRGAEIDQMVSAGEIVDGMVAKLAAARSAMVPVRIGSVACLHQHVKGTMVLPEAQRTVA